MAVQMGFIIIFMLLNGFTEVKMIGPHLLSFN
jgi:hypothetical protein